MLVVSELRILIQAFKSEPLVLGVQLRRYETEYFLYVEFVGLKTACCAAPCFCMLQIIRFL